MRLSGSDDYRKGAQALAFYDAQFVEHDFTRGIRFRDVDDGKQRPSVIALRILEHLPHPPELSVLSDLEERRTARRRPGSDGCVLLEVRQ